jgi:hypothetical protein
MREQLYYHLANTAGLTALVSSRIYPQRIPTGSALPYVGFTFDSRETSYDQDGYDNYNSAVVTIQSNAATLGEAVAVAKQVFLSLNIQNTLIGEAGNQETLCSTTLETESDDFDLFDGSEDGVREVIQTYTITYLEA